MENDSLLDASCRVALAAMLHDLGKFAERADLPLPDREGNEATYCPSFNGRISHRHAAWTARSIDEIEQFLPSIRQGATQPFSSQGDARKDDSLINGAAMHHKPETPLQRIIAVADRLASGFERDTFERYNQAQEGVVEKGRTLHARQIRMWPLLERLRLSEKDRKVTPVVPEHRLPLLPMAPQTLFPAKLPEESDAQARQAYAQLWNQFRDGLQRISHRDHWPLWLDHFDSWWLSCTHAIPSATVTFRDRHFQSIPPDVSLYDHCKATAALGVALWRHHVACGTLDSSFSGSGWQEPGNEAEFFLIQGDFLGIQNFLFSGMTAQRAARLLRGKSFSVSLMCELAALAVLEAFELPCTSQVLNAAGKFQIVAPNLPDAEERLQRVRQCMDEWFLQHTFGQLGIVLAGSRAGREEFSQGQFSRLMARLKQDLEQQKRQQFSLCERTEAVLWSEISYDTGACSACERAPAVVVEEDRCLCRVCHDQQHMGQMLIKQGERLVVSREVVNADTLQLDYFGYRVTLIREADLPNRGRQAWVRLWDLSPPGPAGNQPDWHGVAQRRINTYVPLQGEQVVEFEQLAALAVSDDAGQAKGVAALGVLKGDVDNLGRFFAELPEPTFARMATLSRQLHAFFALWLPWYCAHHFPQTYTVFAGGDDFFLIGPWNRQIDLAGEMSRALRRYAGGNPELHFSAGLTMTKPGVPVTTLSDMAEEALYQAKQRNGKDAITCWDRTVSWSRFDQLQERSRSLQDLLVELLEQYKLPISTAYLYGLLHLCEKAEQSETCPREAIWHAWFVYRTWRMVVDRLHREADKKAVSQRLAQEIGSQIREYKNDYKIALFTCLYQRRHYRKKDEV
ncbi:MAG: type III-A CRISPR-associated protein Cas10/Csm1 [Magnetococcales bacterium]|nr:type III-A CRISPR-associated protein Cas10/Csm1 [Magnetococcales bacterium]